ncbi:MAG: amidohydrolase, partial [Oscillospiraceae bacterium]|nr:amidohydrolase [Oscillospiraceae bacterium]
MIRFFNGRLLSMDGGLDITEDEVWTDGDKICYVGPQKDELPAFGRQIDLKGKLLMPGFKNAHTHSGMSFCRSLADDVPLQPWLFEQIFPLEAKLNPERVYAFTRL